ncbi:MAG: hypothetical protein ACREJC_02015 [Tepidisphaeraceae bacterium]
MKIKDSLKFWGVWEIEHWRRGVLAGHPKKDRVLLARFRQKNIVVDEGINYILNAGFSNGGPIGTWYVATFEGNYIPLSTDTAATFPASSTETTAYDEVSRPEYEEATSTAKSITNAANRATFTYNANKTIYGASLHSVATKAAITGVLAAAARFANPRIVIPTDQLLVSYTINASSA